ncbi:MAG: hypothetical protein EXR43_00440 [Dehalococcoidia bacterium]|nr:hypothetical protein [Dehalococcoidia bacterium]
MTRTYQVISADGHIEGPFDWSKRMPAKYKDAAPKLVKREDDSYVWSLEYAGVSKQQTVGAGLYSGARYDEFLPATARTYWNADGSLRPGSSGEDPIQRLREQDQDGIDAEVLFWPVGLLMVGDLRDKAPDAYKAVIRMYNDFVAEYCSVAPDRLIGNCVLPWTGVDDAIAEIQHARKKGIRSVILQKWPNGSGSPMPEDDRFWAASLDIGMRLSPHGTFGDGIGSPLPPPHDLLTPESALSGLNGQMVGGGNRAITMGQLMPVFDRFPDLKVYFAESQASWLPGHMDFSDEIYQRWSYFFDIKLKKQPSQYIRDHMKFSFIHDRLAMKFRHYIGIDMLMWGTDFPHSVGTFPESKIILEELFEGVPAAERRRVLVDNVCDFFGLDATKPLTETPGAAVAAR